MAPVDLAARLFLGAVAEAEIDLLVFAFRYGDAGRNAIDLGSLHVRVGRRAPDRFDVHEVEELEAVQLSLTIAKPALLEQIAGLERQLASHDPLVDARRRHDLDGPDVREPPGPRGVSNHALAARRAVRLLDVDARGRIAVVLDLVDDHFPSRLHERAVQGTPDGDRESLFERPAMIGRQGVEPGEVDPLDDDGLPFYDVDRDADGFLVLAQLRVERAHARARVPAIFVERDDALQIRFELRPVEEVLFSPGQLRALRGRQDRLELFLGNGLDPGEREALDFDAGALFLTGSGGQEDGYQQERWKTRGTQGTHRRSQNKKPEIVFPETLSGSLSLRVELATRA